MPRSLQPTELTAQQFWPNLTALHAGVVSEVGHFRPIDGVCAMSASPPIATELARRNI
jgi:hypothetical protein